MGFRVERRVQIQGLGSGFGVQRVWGSGPLPCARTVSHCLRHPPQNGRGVGVSFVCCSRFFSLFCFSLAHLTFPPSGQQPYRELAPAAGRDNSWCHTTQKHGWTKMMFASFQCNVNESPRTVFASSQDGARFPEDRFGPIHLWTNWCFVVSFHVGARSPIGAGRVGGPEGERLKILRRLFFLSPSLLVELFQGHGPTPQNPKP